MAPTRKNNKATKKPTGSKSESATGRSGTRQSARSQPDPLKRLETELTATKKEQQRLIEQLESCKEELAANAVQWQRAENSLRDVQNDLERRVVERTQWMALLHEISQLINDASSWDDALQRMLNRLCEVEEWQIGYVYLPDPMTPNTLAPAIHCISGERFWPFHEVSERQHYAQGERLPGRVFAEGIPVWINDVLELLDAIPLRAAAAKQMGLRSCVALPIKVGQDIIAVLELFSDRSHPRNDWFTNLMPAVGDQIGRVLERERTTAHMADLVWREQQDLLHTLHDALGQTLTGLGMLSTGLRQRLTNVDQAASATAAEIAKQAQHALEQVRQLSRSLFPVEVEAESLAAALRELALATQSLHNIRVQVEEELPTDFRDGAVATQLYRIAQEAVTNAVKHAQASVITIRIDGQAGTVRLRIGDNGIGIGNAAKGNGIGLQIMRYRASSIGGILNIESRLRGGTLVTCTLRAVPPKGP